jgi:hypothetical protein
LDAIGQTYSFSDEVGRIVEEWLRTNNIILSDLQAISTTHTEEIGNLKSTTNTHTEEIDELQAIAESHTESISDLSERTAIPSFLIFAGNVNADMVAAAFGRGNESEALGIGKALKMYANFKGNTENIDFLDGYDKYADLVTAHKQKLISNPTL